ncbi:MAG: hypothetical protein JWM76_1752 [Pseudonocardiales bacterium]|nr:hypothetical protein [Pseudonocardiales bacterium]
MNSDEQAIRLGAGHLLATYQYLADAGKIRQLSELFTTDAVFENNTGKHVGPSGVLNFFQSTKGGFINAGFMPARHYLSSIYIEPQAGGGASTYACFQFLGTRGLDHWGTYRDEVVERDGTWMFQRRRAIVEGCVPDSPVIDLLGLGGSNPGSGIS